LEDILEGYAIARYSEVSSCDRIKGEAHLAVTLRTWLFGSTVDHPSLSMPSIDQETYDLYADQLKSLKLGHALYEPESDVDEGEVQIADVGYLDFGRCMRFTSAFTPEQGIPAIDKEHRAILELGRLDAGPMSSRSVHSQRVELEVSAIQDRSNVGCINWRMLQNLVRV